MMRGGRKRWRSPDGVVRMTAVEKGKRQGKAGATETETERSRSQTRTRQSPEAWVVDV